MPKSYTINLIVFMGLIAGFINIPTSRGQVVLWKAPLWADTIKNPLAYNEDVLLKGKVLYVKTCVPCHGESGKGDGVAGISLNPLPGNFTSLKVQMQKDGVLFWKLSKGKGVMPPMESSLTKEMRWQLVHYIRKLGKTK